MAGWDEMTPAQRDQLVAETCGGYERHELQTTGDEVGYYWTKGDDGWWYGCDDDDMPHYSQDIAAAFALLNTLPVFGYEIIASSIGPEPTVGAWSVMLQRLDCTWIQSPYGSFPEMACRAALLLLEVDI